MRLNPFIFLGALKNSITKQFLLGFLSIFFFLGGGGGVIRF
jgi:hypothetical protein